MYVQKRVRTELESDVFLVALQKKIDDAKQALTEKMLGPCPTCHRESVCVCERESHGRKGMDLVRV